MVQTYKIFHEVNRANEAYETFSLTGLLTLGINYQPKEKMSAVLTVSNKNAQSSQCSSPGTIKQFKSSLNMTYTCLQCPYGWDAGLRPSKYK